MSATPDQIEDMKAYVAAAGLDGLTDEDVEAGRCVQDFTDEEVLSIVEGAGGYEGPNGWVSHGGPPGGAAPDDGHVSMEPHYQWVEG